MQEICYWILLNVIGKGEMTNTEYINAEYLACGGNVKLHRSNNVGSDINE